MRETACLGGRGGAGRGGAGGGNGRDQKAAISSTGAALSKARRTVGDCRLTTFLIPRNAVPRRAHAGSAGCTKCIAHLADRRASWRDDAVLFRGLEGR